MGSTKRSPGSCRSARTGAIVAVSDFFDASCSSTPGRASPTESRSTSGWVESPAYSPDGKTLAYGGIGDVTLLDALDAEADRHTSVEGHAARLAFTRDGSKLVP